MLALAGKPHGEKTKMIKNSLNAIGTATRETFRSRGALALASLLYFAMLLLAYYFFATGVASAWQLAVSAVAVLFVPLIFFVLQAALAHVAVAGDRSPRRLVRLALRDFWKLIVVSLPLVALGFGFAYLVGKLEAYVPGPAPPPDPVFLPSGAPPPAPVITWQQTALTTLRFLLFAFVLPLLAARLWIAVAREGLKRTLRYLHRVVARSFAPQSVFIYAVGLLVFGAMPYFMIFTRTPVESGWLELVLFGLRLALAFIFTLWGWTLTLGALAHDAPPLAPPPTPATGRAQANDEAKNSKDDARAAEDGAQPASA